jgi:long-chain fatty acid transport protein
MSDDARMQGSGQLPRSWRSRRGILVVVLAAMACLPAASLAQTNSDINAGLQFNFTPPGAKSLGLGGSFTGLADDATAVYANPAGLTKLSKPEVSVEYRNWRYTNVFQSGTASGQGQLDSSVQAIAFASAVYPVQDWSFAAFFHQGADFTAKLDALPSTTNGVVAGRKGELNLKLSSIGGAAAYHLSESISVGATLADYHYDTASSTEVTATGPTLSVDDIQSASGRGNAVGGSLGASWEGKGASLGLVYRRLPRFATEGRLDRNGKGTFSNNGKCPNGPPTADGFCPNIVDNAGSNSIAANEGLPFVSNCAADPTGLHVQCASHFKVPDIVSLGAGYQLSPAFTLLGEIAYVEYSQMADDLIPLLVQSSPSKKPLERAFDEPLASPGDFSIRNGTELHLGADYRIGLSIESSLFLRLGVWSDPDHALRYTPAGQSQPKFVTRFNASNLHERATHAAGGVGFAVGKRFQLDAGVDHSTRQTNVAVSAVYRF